MVHYTALPTSRAFARNRPVPDPLLSSSEAELRAHIERVLSARYELDREIGRGGMGIVYCARDRRLKRPVAIKLLPPELAFRSEIRTRFLREAEMAAQLSHPSIVPIYTVDEQENLVFFVMAFVDGDNLAKRIHDRGRLPADDVRRILSEVGAALDYAHARKVIHRDIKPDNILLDRETGRAMVTDFGIARAVSDGDSRLTATGMAIGTPAYMSPEQCAGDREIDGRSDLYSLGVVAYQMLSGELPFNATNTPGMLVKHLTERPTPVQEKRADIPPDLARAVMLLLEKNPEHRFPSAAALTVALDNGNVPEPPSAREPRSPRASGASAVGPGPYSPAPWAGGYSPAPAYAPSPPEAAPAPTSREMERWEAKPVVTFRRRLGYFLFIAPILFVLTAADLRNFSAPLSIWAVYIAWLYANLWTESYDWRDVFRQPRDRELLDVASDGIDTLRMLGSPEGRERIRSRRSERRARAPLGAPAGEPFGGAADAAAAAPARQAEMDRDVIVQLVQSLPRRERDELAEVVPSANALVDRIRGLSRTVGDLERASAVDAAGRVEAEIERLEAAANPLEERASEERVRRLALLKRQRRGLQDAVRRERQARERLESCTLALQNMRYDLLRLRAGNQSVEHVTSVAERAMGLAKEIDTAVYVADQLAEVNAPRLSGAPRRAT